MKESYAVDFGTRGPKDISSPPRVTFVPQSSPIHIPLPLRFWLETGIGSSLLQKGRDLESKKDGFYP